MKKLFSFGSIPSRLENGLSFEQKHYILFT